MKNILFIIFAVMFFSSACGDIHNDLWNHLSNKTASDKQITSFEINGYKARISGLTINSVLPYGTSVKALKPQIIHNGYSISPESGETQDFTNPVSYTVTADDGTMAVYTVSVKVLTVAEMSNANLSSLRVKKGKLQPALNSIDVDYLDAPIPFSDSENPAYNDKQSNSIIAEPEIPIATMTMELESKGKVSVENAAEHEFPDIKVGPNEVTIIVTAADKTTKKTYKLNMYRAVPIFKTGAGEISGYDLNPLEDGATQRGVSWPAVRFTINGNGTVTDNMTGLIWLKDAVTLSSGRDFKTAVISAQTDPELNVDNSYNWYLPNINQVRSLLNYSIISGGYNNKPFADLENNQWWTSTTYFDESDPKTDSYYFIMASCDYFLHGTINTAREVWAVQGNSKLLPQTGQTENIFSGDDGFFRKGAEWPVPRFYVYNEDASSPVLDNMTGLMWFKNEISTGKVWIENFNYIEDNINSGNSSVNYGFSDWFIPNVREIETLSNFGKKDMTWLNEIDGIDYFNVSDTLFIWTSTSCASLSDRAYMYKPDCQTVLDYSKNSEISILPARLVKPSEMFNY